MQHGAGKALNPYRENHIPNLGATGSNPVGRTIDENPQISLISGLARQECYGH